MIHLEDSKVIYENGVHIGDILCDVDGYYYFWPKLRGGSWPAHLLRAIADKLDEMNRSWDSLVQSDPSISP